MHYSMWKLNAVAAVVRGKSLLDAKASLGDTDKKGSKFIGELIDEIKDKGVKRGLKPEQIYVRTATVGGNVMHRKPDIKGRGRNGIIRKP